MMAEQLVAVDVDFDEYSAKYLAQEVAWFVNHRQPGRRYPLIQWVLEKIFLPDMEAGYTESEVRDLVLKKLGQYDIW